MKTVIYALKAMGKSTCREISARLNKDVRDMLKILENMEDQGAVKFVNGYWSVASAEDKKQALPAEPAKTVLRAKNLNDTPKKPLRGEVAEPIKPESIVALLTESGNMGTVALALAVERDPRGLASNLCLMAKRGYIQKIGQGKGVKWGLPDYRAVPVVPEFAELPDIEITPKVAAPAVADTDRVQVEEFLDSIPVLKKASQPVLVPTLREISNEIRKTKSNLDSLEKLRDAVREVNRNRRVLRLFVGEAE
ncbi:MULTISPECIES: DUF1627 domain-containing protein [Citrobacter]|uniref:DUF1627 domain-containing protein n=1 Tax=Citrobacter TaxID=544 RepID=UPI001B957706|nr:MULTISPECIES: DUF1627 domain-containing protein [Citrobacter]MCH2697472.1 hypothetical protein [Citrobacter portucalensis]MDM2861156.1 DUF1627 domain-containing protein [Citrobacter sp. Cpo073]